MKNLSKQAPQTSQAPRTSQAPQSFFSERVTMGAEKENIKKLIEFAEDFFVRTKCPKDIITDFCIAIDEAAANICSYAYPVGTAGTISLNCRFDKALGEYGASFSDSGIPFDPLGAPAADTSAPASERTIGGLGIHIIRNLMDDIRYEYSEGRNILSITKRLYSKPKE